MESICFIQYEQKISVHFSVSNAATGESGVFLFHAKVFRNHEALLNRFNKQSNEKLKHQRKN